MSKELDLEAIRERLYCGPEIKSVHSKSLEDIEALIAEVERLRAENDVANKTLIGIRDGRLDNTGGRIGAGR